MEESVTPDDAPDSVLPVWYETFDSKTYKNYVQSIDKCLKNFEYSIEWPDLIAALTKLNKVISVYNSTLKSCSPPLPRTTLITKRLSQCLHPNLPSGVHLKTLETFDQIFHGFKTHDYVHLETDLFSFVSGLLPLWSYAGISVKPKLLAIYETHFLGLGIRLLPALNGILLSLFNGLVDDGVEQDIKIRINEILSTLSTTFGVSFNSELNRLILSVRAIHLPCVTYMQSCSIPLTAGSLKSIMESPNVLVQRIALECISDDDDEVIMTSVLKTLLKRDMSLTRRVYKYIEPRQPTVVRSIIRLINENMDAQSLTRVLSSVLDNPNIDILQEILPPVTKSLMSSDSSISVCFLSLINESYLRDFFTTYLFKYDSVEELECNVRVYNYVLSLNLFTIPYDQVFENLKSLEDAHMRVILAFLTIQYKSNSPEFLLFYKYYVSRFINLSDFEQYKQRTPSVPDESPVVIQYDLPVESFKHVNALLRMSDLDDEASVYVCLSAASKHAHAHEAIVTYLKFQDSLTAITTQTHVVSIIFNYLYVHNVNLLNELVYPERYLLRVLKTDADLENVVSNIDLRSKHLTVLKLIDPQTMNTPFKSYISETLIKSNPNVILSSILKYLEFTTSNTRKSKSESNLVDEDTHETYHSSSVELLSNNIVQTCAYDSTRTASLINILDFVIQISDDFVTKIDVIPLLSKLTILSTIQNSNETDPSVQLHIQTSALHTINKVLSRTEVADSFILDSVLTHMSAFTDSSNNLWELSAIPIISKYLGSTTNSLLPNILFRVLSTRPSTRLITHTQDAWVKCITDNLPNTQTLFVISLNHVISLVSMSDSSHARTLISYLCVCLKDLLMAHVVETPQPQVSFLSSLFGSSRNLDSEVGQEQNLRTTVLSRLHKLVEMSCSLPYALVDNLLTYLLKHHEPYMHTGISKCFTVPNVSSLVHNMRMSPNTIANIIVEKSNPAGIPVLISLLKHNSSVEITQLLSVCKITSSDAETLQLVSAYISVNSVRTKELQDLVIRVLEHAVEARNFVLLENHVPAIFDLVWGESDSSNKDHKVIINIVHSFVIAIIVQIKACTPSPNYTSALRILEQISHHNYLRKSWKKETFEFIINEQLFFYFSPDCLQSWKIIVDNLFTQDRSTFNELITRLTQTTQMSTSALSNIFSSKDSEVYETRASLLKRLAFVIHCSERDQYAKYITNIQEKIAEALKIGGGSTIPNTSIVIPPVNNAVFLCFRIMLLKFNHNILTSLWPIIVHEIVMVLTTLISHVESPPSEDSLNTDTLSLYLQTLKLLNFLFTSSSDTIPHFQLYKWAFETESSTLYNFTPYVTKLKNLATSLYPNIKFKPPLLVRSVDCLEHLCEAFGAINTPVCEQAWEIIDFSESS